MVRNYNPVIEVGQRTNTTHSFTIIDPSERPYEPIDLSDAEAVYLTMEHRSWGTTAVDGEECDIPESSADEGYVEYSFSDEETSDYGTHYIQFEIEWEDGDETLIPPDGYEWTVHVGRRLPRGQPMRSSRGVFDELSVGHIDVETLSITDSLPEATIDDLTASTGSIDILDVDTLSTSDGDVTLSTADISRLSFDEFGGEPLSAFGGGFTLDDEGRPRVDIDEFGEIEGITNPLTDDVHLSNYYIRGPGRMGTESAPISAGWFETLAADTIDYEGETVETTVGADSGLLDTDDPHNNDWGVHFQVDRPATIKEVTVSADFDDSLQIRLAPFEAGEGVGDTIVQESFDLEEGENRVELDYEIPEEYVGEDLILDRRNWSGRPLFRPEADAYYFPTREKPFVFLGGGRQSNGDQNDRWYYFTDWDVEYETADNEIQKENDAVSIDSAEFESIPNVTEYCKPGTPVSEINRRFTILSTRGGGTLFLQNGEYTADESLEVPDNCTITCNRRQASIVVKDADALTAYDDISPGGTDRPIKAVVTNRTREDAEGVIIENIHVRHDTVAMDETEGDGYYWAGIMLSHAGEDCEMRGSFVEDIMPDAESVGERAFGHMFTYCTGSTGYDLRSDGCGYEGFTVRGADYGVTLEKLRGWGNNTHTLQVAGLQGTGSDENDRPKGITIRDVYTDRRIIHHGIGRSNTFNEDENIVIENVRFSNPANWSAVVRVMDECRGTVVRDCDNVILEQTHNSSNTFENILVENCGHDTAGDDRNDAGVAFYVNGSSGATIRGVTIRNCTIRGGRLAFIEDRTNSASQISGLRFENCSVKLPDGDDDDEDEIDFTSSLVYVENAEIEDMTFSGCWANTEHLVHTDDGSVDDIRIYDSDVRDLENDVVSDEDALQISTVRSTHGLDDEGAGGGGGWEEIGRYSFEDESFTERIHTPDYVGQRGEGSVRITVRWESPDSTADIKLRVSGQGSDNHNYLIMDGDGEFDRRMGVSEWTLAENQPSGFQGGAASAVITCPRERPVCTQAHGSSRGISGGFMVKGSTSDTTNFTWIEVESDQEFGEIEVIAESTPNFNA